MRPSNLPSEFVSEDAWGHRKAFVGFSPADEETLRELRPVALHYADEVMNELYARWLQFPELRRFFPDAAALARVKALQRQYFISLTGGEYGAAYLAYRLKVGAVHRRIGLTLEWFMGAYSIYLELVLPRVLRAFEYDRIKQARAVTALTKLITLDEQLALVAYCGGADCGTSPRAACGGTGSKRSSISENRCITK
jgi:rsbT co-antagonist protein RsbR